MKKSNKFISIPKAIFCVDLSSRNPRVSIYSNGSPFFQTELDSASPELRAALASPTNKVMLCPPFKSIIVSTLTPPPVARRKQVKLIPSLLNIQLPFKLEECKYVFNRLGSAFIAQTIRNTELAETISFATKNKLTPTNIIGYIQILWETAIAQSTTWGAEEERALCVANKSSTLLIIGNKKGIISSNAFNNSSAKEIIKRLKLAFKNDISKVALFLAGEDAHTILKDMRNVAPLGLINMADNPEYFIADSCANSKKASSYNFIGSIAKSSNSLNERIQKKMTFMILAASGVILASSFFINSNTERIKKLEQAHFKNTVSKVAGYEINTKGSRAIEDAKTAYDARFDQSMINAQQSLITSKQFPKCMELCELHGIKLSFISLEFKGLTATGSAPNHESLNKLIKELNSSGIKCVLTNATPTPTEEGRITFEVFPGK